MVVIGGASVSGEKMTEPNKRGNESKDKQRKKSPLACFSCKEKHIVKNCREWQVVLEAIKKSRNVTSGPHNP